MQGINSMLRFAAVQQGQSASSKVNAEGQGGKAEKGGSGQAGDQSEAGKRVSTIRRDKKPGLGHVRC